MTALLAGSAAALGGAAAGAAVPPACPLEIQGHWQSAGSADPLVVSFSADGWANVLGGARQARATDLDILAQVRYELDEPRAPERIVFHARRGNDLFSAGESVWEIGATTADSFVARVNGAERLWTRVPTHRYFLALAHRADSPTGENAATFATWIALDGRGTTVEAFGVHAAPGRSAALFGQVPPDVAGSMVSNNRESDVVLRIEIDAAEYLRSHRMLEAWSTFVESGFLADEDPHRLALDFLATVIASVNRCRLRVKLPDETAALGTDAPPRQRLPVMLTALRKANATVHVVDAAFPRDWKPPELTP